jgi:hypothetical protein
MLAHEVEEQMDLSDVEGLRFHLLAARPAGLGRRSGLAAAGGLGGVAGFLAIHGILPF